MPRMTQQSEVTPRGHQLLAEEKEHGFVNPFPWTTQEGEGALIAQIDNLEAHWEFIPGLRGQA